MVSPASASPMSQLLAAGVATVLFMRRQLLPSRPNGRDRRSEAWTLCGSFAQDLNRLSATFLTAGSLDLFLEENAAYALRLSRAGVLIDLRI